MSNEKRKVLMESNKKNIIKGGLMYLAIIIAFIFIYMCASDELKVNLGVAAIWAVVIGALRVIVAIWKYCKTKIKSRILWKMVKDLDLRKEIKTNGREAALAIVRKNKYKHEEPILVIGAVVVIALIILIGNIAG
jgi:hypothetical protein